MNNSIQNLAKKIITLNPENKKMMVNIVNQLFISEASSKLGIKPTDLKCIIDKKDVQHETKIQ